jgi:hypothetical protein
MIVNGKVVPVHTIRAYRGSRGELHFNLGPKYGE